MASQTTLGNPKGKLLEFCARIKALPPTLAVEQSDQRWGVVMILVVHGRTLESRMHWGLARIDAEQMAAGDILAQLAAASEGEPDERVAGNEEEALRLQNPKGKLLERCMQLRVTPAFDVQPVLTTEGNAFEASVSVTLHNGDELWSEVRRASSAKGAEQAAAASLLPQLLRVLATETTSPVPVPSPAGDARNALNELRQLGKLRDYGFVLERVDGPPHAPVFVVKAFALEPGGARVEVPAVTGRSKKEAERTAAERLFAELHVRGS